MSKNEATITMKEPDALINMPAIQHNVKTSHKMTSKITISQGIEVMKTNPSLFQLSHTTFVITAFTLWVSHEKGHTIIPVCK